MKLDAIDNAISVLNRLHEADPTVMSKLIFHRVPCNKTVAEDETIQVGVKIDENGTSYEVGILGIINGLFGVNEKGVGYIAADFDLDGTLIKFVRLHIE